MKNNDILSVFLVDDDKMFLHGLEHHLQQKLKPAIRIRSFSNGEEALKSLDEKPDIVVLDYLLNGDYPYAMNGLQVLDRIKKAEPDINVVMLSVQDKADVAVDTIKHGAFDYVVKNHNTFLKAQNAVRGAIMAVKNYKDARNYKRWMWMILVTVGIIAAVAVAMQLFSPRLM